MKTRTFRLATALAGVSLMGTLALPSTAQASANGRKNTAIGLGALAVQQLLSGKTTNGLVVGAGAAYAYKRYQDATRDEKRRTRVSSYRSSSTRTSASSANRYGGSSLNSSYRTYPPTQAGINYGRYGSFVFTGPITRDATNMVNRKLTVDHFGTLRPVSVPKDTRIIMAGRPASVHDLQRGDVVRVTALKTGENQWQAQRIEVIQTAGVAADTADDSAAYVDDRDVTTTTRDRVTDRTDNMARYTGVGVVRSIDAEAHTFVIRAGDHSRTVFTNDADFGGVNSLRDLRVGDRVRITGDMNDNDVYANQVTLLD